MQIEHSNEVELIRETLAGDTSAFDQLVKIHRGTVYVLVLSYTKNPADAEDVTQRIFIRAYERLATLRELDRFPLWLQQIAHNACKDWLRRRHNSVLDFELMNCAAFVKTVPTPEDIALKREIEAIVREAIGALQETDRKLVEGRYIEGASYDQLQVESGLSYSAIASRLKRAKQQMRRRIEKLLGGMAILPGRTFIWGGIETVKFSVKTKLAMVGVVAVLGIGGGVLYHTLKSNPVVMMIIGNSLIGASHRTNPVSGSHSTTGGESMSKFNEKGESVHTDAENYAQVGGSGKALAAMKLFNGMGGLTAEVISALPLSEETRQTIEADQARIAGYYESGNVETKHIRTELTIKGELGDLPVDIRQAIEGAKNSDGVTIDSVDGNTIITIEGDVVPPPTSGPMAMEEVFQRILPEDTLQAIRDSDFFIGCRVQTSTTTPEEVVDGEVAEQRFEAYRQAYRELARLLPGASYQERADGTYAFSSPSRTASGSTESQSNPTDSGLTPPDESVESTTVSAEPSEETMPLFAEPSEGTTPLSDQEWGAEDWREFEQLLSEFSDEDWAEFERLLRASGGGEPSPWAQQAPLNVERQQEIEKTLKKPSIDQLLNAKRQREIEKVFEEVPIDESALKEMRRQRRVPPKRDTRVPPRPKNVDRDRER